MERVIIKEQTCDMGEGHGEWVFNKKVTLGEFLTHLKEQSHEWGTITIQYKNGDILRKFDYDTFNNSVFYICLSGWQKDIEIDKVKFNYCFMNEDVKIILNK